MKHNLCSITLSMLILGLSTGCGTEESEQLEDGPFKAAWLYIGGAADLGWTKAHDNGRKDVDARFGEQVKTSYLENIPEGDEATQAIQQLVDAGNDIVFTTSWGFMDPTLTVAQKHSEVKFEHCSGYKTSENMTNYFARIYEARYLSGVVAGHMTTNERVGYVAAFPIPEVIRGINAFTLGLRSVKPNAQVYVKWTCTWFGPDTEGDAASDIIATHDVDIITQHQDSLATVFAAQDAGIYAIGYDNDMYPLAQDTIITSAVFNWGPYYVNRVEAGMHDTWDNTPYWGGFQDDMVKLGTFHPDVSESTKTQIDTMTQQIKSGQLHPFQGPILYQDGSTWLVEGEVMSDADMLGMDSMNAFVAGINGTTTACQ